MCNTWMRLVILLHVIFLFVFLLEIQRMKQQRMQQSNSPYVFVPDIHPRANVSLLEFSSPNIRRINHHEKYSEKDALNISTCFVNILTHLDDTIPDYKQRILQNLIAYSSFLEHPPHSSNRSNDVLFNISLNLTSTLLDIVEHRLAIVSAISIVSHMQHIYSFQFVHHFPVFSGPTMSWMF